MIKGLLIGFIVAAALLSSPAQAQFTFTVPVNLRNLPASIERMYINCDIFTGTPLRPVTDNTTTVQAIIHIPQVPNPTGAAGTVGEFIGDATIIVNVRPGWDPAIITHYECYAGFVGNVDGATVNYFDRSNPEGPRFPIVEGQPFLLQTGILPLPR